MSKSLRKKLIWAGLMVLGLGVLWFVNIAFRAHSRFVTLYVRDTDVGDVVKRIERQTWQKILVHPKVSGRVSLRLEDVPLADALEVVARQAGCRWHLLYPLYSSPDSLDRFKQAVLGDVDPVKAGWTNLPAVVSSPFSARPGGQGLDSEQPVTVQMTNRSLRLTSLVFSRFGNVKLIPEDGTPDTVTLRLRATPIPEAVQTVANSLQRQTTPCLALMPRAEGGPGAGRPPPFMPGPPMSPPGAPPAPSQDMQDQMNQDYSELMSVLPLDQQLRLKSESEFPASAGGPPGPGQPPNAQPTQSPELEKQRRWLQESSVAERVNQDRRDAASRPW